MCVSNANCATDKIKPKGSHLHICSEDKLLFPVIGNSMKGSSVSPEIKRSFCERANSSYLIDLRPRLKETVWIRLEFD